MTKPTKDETGYGPLDEETSPTGPPSASIFTLSPERLFSQDSYPYYCIKHNSIPIGFVQFSSHALAQQFASLLGQKLPPLPSKE